MAATKSRFVTEVADEERKLGKKKKEQLILELLEVSLIVSRSFHDIRVGSNQYLSTASFFGIPFTPNFLLLFPQAGFFPYVPSQARVTTDADNINEETQDDDNATEAQASSPTNARASNSGKDSAKYIEIPAHINIATLVHSYALDEDNYNVLGLKRLYTNTKTGKTMYANYQHTSEPATYHLAVNSYDYLLNMSLFSLTHERVDALNKEKEDLITKYDVLHRSTPESMWMAELDELEAYLKNSLRVPMNENDIEYLRAKEEEERKKRTAEKKKANKHAKSTPETPVKNNSKTTASGPTKPKSLQDIAAEAKAQVKKMTKANQK